MTAPAMIQDTARPAGNGATGPMSIVSIAAGGCHPVATAGGATVATPIARPPTGNGQDSPPNSVTPTNTKRHATVIECENCGREFTPRRPHGRFCGSYCRRLAWLGRNPDKAAELAERDRARLRAHVIGGGGEWVDRCHNGA